MAGDCLAKFCQPMAFNERIERSIVGKRFLAVSSSKKLKVNEFQSWPWKFGIIRASSERNLSSRDLQVNMEWNVTFLMGVYFLCQWAISNCYTHFALLCFISI